jgi:nanoRNase/pAp phosphatase (c-di-AMP/oligoRNAs hydrolase)
MQTPIEQPRYRLLTRSDFDGLVCAILLKEVGILGEIKFVHPKDVQDGKVEVTSNDILTNLPYVQGCHLCFDHHASESTRNGGDAPNHILQDNVDSAARVLYNYYGGRRRFAGIDEALLKAVDKADMARFDLEEILDPQGWALLSFLMDPRTGLGRFRDFRISNYQLMMQLIDNCRNLSVEEVLALPDLQERVELYRAHQDAFREQLHRCADVFGNVVVLDLRDEETIYAGNRFVIYALYPQCNVSMHVMWGLKQQNTVFAMGKSILNRSSQADIGNLALEYGGGGHAAAGTCQVDHEEAPRVQQELIERLQDESAVALCASTAGTDAA